MTVLKGVDSWNMPSATQLQAAKAAGIGLWAGYFSNGSDGIYGGGWDDAAFDQVMAFGLKTLAFVSTRADPVAWKARAARLGIVIVADVESSVDGGDGPHVDPWLAASGAHLYGGGPRGDGTIPRHLPHSHTGYMVADYEGRPGWGTASWPGGDPKPNAPVAWQYEGGQPHAWGNTDMAIYDETFVTPGGIAPPAPEDDDVLLYQQKNGTVSLLTGGKLVNLGSPADIAYLTGLGVKTMLEANITPAFAANILAAAADPAPAVSTGVVTGTFTGNLKG